jgi:cytochrome c-type biogenesis protein CcmF
MIEYVGEHSFWGQFGNLLTIISAVAALFAAVSYFLAHIRSEGEFRKLARIGFTVHSLALIGAVLSLFYILFNLYFEYDYVWKHANKDMPLRYVFSCFWEGQEGSFLLWSFWHVILGNILMRTARSWENLTMAIVSLVQVLLGSMVLGIYVFDLKIGNSPFTLIRELPENIGLPWTEMPDYLSAIPTFQNGRGLNPLLQNYWMTIHPPTLFLGYASTIVPFAFAIAGLLSGKFREWLRPAIPWAFFSVSVLGIGILMGGAWAYEALSFGGFWAWDPVENASLIPWLTLVGGAHLMVVNQHKNNSIFAAFFMILITYVLVMYASFLVHSGVLGDTSVHSFTANGLMKQHLFILSSLTFISVFALLQSKQLRLTFSLATVFLFIVGVQFNFLTEAIITFLLTGLIMSIISYRKLFPKPKKEEPLWSREFWIFIGSLVFILSAGQILLETSKPIWNIIAQPFSGLIMGIYELTDIEGFRSLAEGKLAPHSDRIGFFNKWQVPFAFIVTFLIAFTQFLRYGKNKFSVFAKKIALSIIVSLAVAILSAIVLDYDGDEFSLAVLLFTTVFAILANLDYLVRMVKGKFDFAGPSVAHIGFGLVLLGALISTSRSIKISENTSRFNIEQLNEGFSNNEDILLFKQDTVPMGPYFVSYKDRSKEGVNVYYEVEYFDRLPRSYQKGDFVIARGAIFEALEDHTPNADGDFIMDQRKWELVSDPRNLDIENIKSWSPFRPGGKLFSLNPRIQLNPEFGNVAEPSTKRYLDKDIYTHVRWAELEVDSDATGYRTPIEMKLGVGDTAFVGSTMIRLNALSVVADDEKEDYMLAPNDLAVRASVGIKTSKGEVYEAEPLYILRDSVLPIPDPVIQDETGLRINFEEIDPRTGNHTFKVAEHISNRKEFIVLQAIQFPMINLLWLGCIMMFVGTVMAVRHRIKISKRKLSK